MRKRTKAYIGFTVLVLTALGTWQLHAWASDASGFPDGLDAVQAAPDSHKVIFENTLVRVLEVTVPPSGQTEPMHHHRWPSFFLEWDTGGKSPHIRYHQPGGIVRDSPGGRGADSHRALVHSLDEAGTHARHRVSGE